MITMQRKPYQHPLNIQISTRTKSRRIFHSKREISILIPLQKIVLQFPHQSLCRALSFQNQIPAKTIKLTVKLWETRQSKQCGFSIYTFDNLKSKSMVRLVRAEKMVLSGLVFARKIARMILIQNI